jgi:hypothetical protein
MNAASGRNLSGVFTLDGNDVGPAGDNGGALGDVADTARFCRTTMTSIWGVSDPPRRGGGVKKGAAKWGSLTPQMHPPLLLTAALTATRAAHSAARTATKSHTAKNIAESNATRTTLSQPQLGTEQLTVGGTLLPLFCSPDPARHSYASCVY